MVNEDISVDELREVLLDATMSRIIHYIGEVRVAWSVG